MVIFDRRKKASAVNPGTIEIEVSYNRERIRLSTGVAVLRQLWSGREVVNRPETERLNGRSPPTSNEVPLDVPPGRSKFAQKNANLVDSE